MPANEQRLADYLGVWGRRQIILNKSGSLNFMKWQTAVVPLLET